MQEAICNRIISNDLSVRATEQLIKNINQTKRKKFKVKGVTLEHFPDAEQKLRELLGTKVSILFDGKKGKINIEFYSKEDLRKIVNLLIRER